MSSLLRALHAVHAHVARLRANADDRGDVPGWVLVTVMTAGLVTAIWLVADGQLTSVLDRAIGSVSQP
jgi:3-hydroxyacyl-CoA dehydrogenase